MKRYIECDLAELWYELIKTQMVLQKLMSECKKKQITLTILDVNECEQKALESIRLRFLENFE